MKLFHFRKKYHPSKLNENEVDPDPVEFFKRWFKEAIDERVNKPEAMVLATSTPEGKPSARVVLLKSITVQGFRFFTNYESRKGEEISYNKNVSLLFHWPELERQVRIEGHAEKTNDTISDEYFDSRPLDSRISAIISPQSRPVPDRSYLDNLWDKKESELHGKKIPRPEFWGGYIVIPEKIEFWQTGDKRLHDRILYYKEENQWKITRLAP